MIVRFQEIEWSLVQQYRPRIVVMIVILQSRSDSCVVFYHISFKCKDCFLKICN
ncbi:hypothetical protein Hdeb2414_s0009g00311141 [Helianthus debilis subsp. tardiflorus]